MTEKRTQSPHYIPELDPENPDRKSDLLERTFLWLEYLRLAFIVLGAIGLAIGWFSGADPVLLGAVGIVLIVMALTFFIGS